MDMETLTLENFEEEVEAAIVGRGRRYFANNRVAELTEDDGFYTALVDGSEAYETELRCDGQTLTDLNCTCPYVLGPVCKHEVALIYAVLDSLNQGQHPSPVKVRKVKPKKPKAKTPSIESIVKSLDRSELESIIVNYADHNREFSALVKRHAPISTHLEDLKPIYKSQIKDCIRAVSDRHGFVEYSRAHHASLAADELSFKAQQLITKREFEHATQILQALLEEVYPAIEHIDDSDGNFNMAIDRIWSGFHTVIEAISNDSPLGKQLFSYFLNEAGKKKYSGWLLEYDLYGLASQLVKNDSDRQKLFSKLDELESAIQEENRSWRVRDLEKGVDIKINTYRLLGDDEAAEALVTEYLAFPGIRKGVIQKALSENNLDYAKILAKEGAILAEKDRFSGLSRDFEEMLLDIAKREADVDTQKFYLQKFFCERRQFDCYDNLKKLYASSEWDSKWPELLQIVKENSETALDIYLKENQLDLFLNGVQTYCQNRGGGSLYLLQQYHKPMSEHFRDELISLYSNALKQWLPEITGRSKYQEFCQYLRRMKKIGGVDEVNAIVSHCRVHYRQRPALQDELTRV